MFCPECGNHAANKAIRKLEESGRIGKEVQSYKEILPEGRYEFRYGTYSATVDSHYFREGDTVTLVLDGVTYTDTAKHHHMEDPEDPSFAVDYFYIGNPTVLGFEDNGKPYGVLCLSTEEDGVMLHMVQVLVVSEYMQTVFVNHTVSVYKPETIHPIDQKYLPGVCLPLVIDLAQYESDGSTLGEVLQSAIDQSINGTPTMAVIKDTNCALQNALNSAQDRQVLLKITYTYLDDAAPAYAYVPVTIFRYPSGDHAMSLSAKIAVVKNASVYDLSVGLMFPYVKNEGINLACLAKSLL